MPVNDADSIKQFASKVSAKECLDEGWRSIVDLLPEEEVEVYKSNAFLASETRIDDHRMEGKYKTDDDDSSSRYKYIVATYSVSERERMMGLPVGYVKKPIEHLFEELEQKAFLKPETTSGSTYR